MTENIQDLESRLVQAQSLQAEIDALNELAWALRQSQAERALLLSQRAYQLSVAGEFSGRPYHLGQASSLTTQAFLNHQHGKLDSALDQCGTALALLEGLPPSRVAIDLMRLTSWIHYFLGDFTSSLDYGLRALHLAQALGLKIQEASVLDGLAMIYTASGDLEQALASQEQALRIARAAGEPVLESVVLNNKGIILFELGQFSTALIFCSMSAEFSFRILPSPKLPCWLNVSGRRWHIKPFPLNNLICTSR